MIFAAEIFGHYFIFIAILIIMVLLWVFNKKIVEYFHLIESLPKIVKRFFVSKFQQTGISRIQLYESNYQKIYMDIQKHISILSSNQTDDIKWTSILFLLQYPCKEGIHSIIGYSTVNCSTTSLIKILCMISDSATTNDWLFDN